MKNEVILFGRDGQLGTAIAKALNGHSISWQSVPWDQLAPALAHGDARGHGNGDGNEQILSVLPKFSSDIRYTLVCANGLTDPSVGREALRFSNVTFVQKLWSALREQPNIRILTFGTIHERFAEFCAQNLYFASKAELSNWIQSLNKKRLLHLRLHTLYGGQLKPHMFLGQIANALATNQPFQMTSGAQLREYHHVDDIAEALIGLINKDWAFGPILEINSGKAVRLADLATAIFDDFKKHNLLSIGVKPQPKFENVESRFEVSPLWLLPKTREPIRGVIAALHENLEN